MSLLFFVNKEFGSIFTFQSSSFCGFWSFIVIYIIYLFLNSQNCSLGWRFRLLFKKTWMPFLCVICMLFPWLYVSISLPRFCFSFSSFGLVRPWCLSPPCWWSPEGPCSLGSGSSPYWCTCQLGCSRSSRNSALWLAPAAMQIGNCEF